MHLAVWAVRVGFVRCIGIIVIDENLLAKCGTIGGFCAGSMQLEDSLSRPRRPNLIPEIAVQEPVHIYVDMGSELA